jgi:hypothetical protein
MAFSQWWIFTEGYVSSDKDEGGVYEFANREGVVIYIGSTGTIRSRLRQRLSEDAQACIKRNATQYRIEYRSDYAAEELRLYDAYVKDKGSKPECNVNRPSG